MKETIVEDFDQTIKLLKAGLTTRCANTQHYEAPTQYGILLLKERDGIVEIFRY